MRIRRRSRSANNSARVLRRLTDIAIQGFILFVVIMFIIWAGPKIWHWALG